MIDTLFDHPAVQNAPPGEWARPVVAQARRSDPDTSHAAAASVTDLRAKQAAVLRFLARHPFGLTDDELRLGYEANVAAGRDGFPAQSPSGLRTRRRELERLDLVVDTGEKRQIRSTGRWAKVWQATDLGAERAA